MTKITVDRALIEQAVEALTKSVLFCNHMGVGDWQPTAMVCHSGIAALRAALAEPAGEPVKVIPLKDGKYLKQEPFYFLGPVCWVLYTENGKQMRALDEFESGFVNAALKASPPPPAEPAVEPVAEVKVKMTGGNAGIATVIHEIHDPLREPLPIGTKLYTSPPPPAESVKPPGMAVQALAGEIVAALLADEKDGGYDLTAGMFGPAFSVLVRRWAAAEWSSPPAEPVRTSQDVCTVPLLSDEEIAAEAEKHTLSDSEERQWYGDNYTVNVNSPQGAKTFARAIEQLVRRKAGL